MRPESKEFFFLIDEALAEANGEDSYNRISELVENYGEGRKQGRMLAVMSSIDNLFYSIHPRLLHLPDSNAFSPGLTHWLNQLQMTRIKDGCYLKREGRVLVPRGPLTRTARAVTTSCAEVFRDRFHSLSVCDLTSKINEVPVSFDVKVIGVSRKDGVGSVENRPDIFRFIPVAIDKDDLNVSQEFRNGQDFIDFKVSDGARVKACVLDGIVAGDNEPDFVIVPEFMITENIAGEISDAIFRNPASYRLFLAGTGATLEEEDGQSWNEARMMNARGQVLWRQRKIWQADLPCARADKLGVFPTVKSGSIMEDNASGENLVIADVEDLGRCVILICQDVKASPLTNYVIDNFQPDWVFVPLLDFGVDEGRWSHDRCYALSSSSAARYLVSTSLSLAEKVGDKNLPCASAIGPKDSDGEKINRAAVLVRLENESNYVDVSWDAVVTKTKMMIK
ncbi:hypothetical protein PMI29_00550 [Pseudomonas sp. GM49]|nr:hypothetical protein PMI29_00550 [Pseudomonas sp. GM49]